ncbi:hypothetical protein Tco_1219138 [Tanacetum coccineum]
MSGRCYKRYAELWKHSKDEMTKKMEKIQCFWWSLVEAFKTDLEESSPEATDERCKPQYVDLAKSLPSPLPPAAIIEPTKDDNTEMEQVWSLQAEYLQRREKGTKEDWLEDGRICYEEFQTMMKAGTEWRKASLAQTVESSKGNITYVALNLQINAAVAAVRKRSSIKLVLAVLTFLLAVLTIWSAEDASKHPSTTVLVT